MKEIVRLGRGMNFLNLKTFVVTNFIAFLCCRYNFSLFQMFIYEDYGADGFATNVVLLIVVGFLVNGPYALITTAVSADLGTHHSLEGNAKALATVSAIIDGTGSVGV
jgi:OPA family glycerol-3-phosphate transporter-like MFS transporter 1/2